MLPQVAQTTGKIAAGDMTSEGYTPGEFRAAVRADPEGLAAAAYRRWVRCVLFPLSEKAAQAVIQRADLLDGAAITPLLMQLVAHVSAYRVILRRWEEQEAARATTSSADHFSAIPYPEDLESWVSDAFEKLKRRQASLLGIRQDGSQGSPFMRLIAAKL